MFDLNTPEWFAKAPCIGEDRLFFSAHPSKRRMAVAKCTEECGNTEKCLQFALDNKMTQGVWGGKNWSRTFKASRSGCVCIKKLMISIQMF